MLHPTNGNKYSGGPESEKFPTANQPLPSGQEGMERFSLPTLSPERVRFDRCLDLYGPLSSRASTPRGEMSTAISEGTFALTQLEQLGSIVGARCWSHLGALSLRRSIAAPPKEIELVLARQLAVRALCEKSEESRCVKRFVKEAAPAIESIRVFVEHPGRRTFKDLYAARDGVARLAKIFGETPAIDNQLLLSSLEAVRDLTEAPVIRLLREPVCLVHREPTPAKDAPLWNRFAHRLLHFPFGPKMSAAIVLAGVGFGIVKSISFLKHINEVAAIMAYEMSVAIFTPIAHKEKPERDNELFFTPIANRLSNDPSFQRGWTALGLLDELYALAQLSERYRDGGSFPVVAAQDRHSLRASKLHNPILALSGGRSVANDFSVEGSRVLGVTGPNSGGKSTFAITAIQTHVLAQLGAPVPAAQCDLSVPDEMFYQAQDFNQLLDKEGRFGTELLKTKEIFLRASPKTLLVFDELAQGTTHEESRSVTDYVLKGFKRIGSSAILITHDHGVVASLAEEGIVEPLKVEFQDGLPTHRIVPGISTTSHALRVARRIEFDSSAVEEILSRRGFTPSR